MLESLARVYSSGSERMIGHLDFTAGPAIVAALIAAALFPALLAAVSRLPRLRARNALQFLAQRDRRRVVGDRPVLFRPARL